jgi:hypothetical protein
MDEQHTREQGGNGAQQAGASTASPTLVPVSAEQIAGALRLPTPQGAPPKRGPAFWVPVIALAILVTLALVAAAFFFGRGTRMSDSEVSSKLSKAHAADVRAARAHERVALADQKRALIKVHKREIRRLNKLSYTKGRTEGVSAGYASGQSAGFSSGESQGLEKGRDQGREEGREEGRTEGYTQGFDEGTCYTAGTLEYVC